MITHVIHLTALDELLAASELWNDLWRRSDLNSPTLRASLVALWMAHFGKLQPYSLEARRFRALVVEHDGRWVAGLPLVGARVGRVLSTGTWPANEWSDSGDLLLDPAVDPRPVLDALAKAMDLLPWPLLRLADVPIEAARWQHLLAAGAVPGGPTACCPAHVARPLPRGRRARAVVRYLASAGLTEPVRWLLQVSPVAYRCRCLRAVWGETRGLWCLRRASIGFRRALRAAGRARGFPEVRSGRRRHVPG